MLNRKRAGRSVRKVSWIANWQRRSPLAQGIVTARPRASRAPSGVGPGAQGRTRFISGTLLRLGGFFGGCFLSLDRSCLTLVPDTCAQRIHQVDDIARRLLLRSRYRNACLLLVEELGERRFVMVLEFVRLKVPGLLLDDMLREIEYVLGDFHVLDFMPVSYEVDGTQYIAIQSGWGVDAQRIQDALATQNIGLENNVPQGGVVWVFAVKK